MKSFEGGGVVGEEGGEGGNRETVLRQIGLLLLRHHCYTTACAYCFTINMTLSVFCKANISCMSNDKVYCIVFFVVLFF